MQDCYQIYDLNENHCDRLEEAGKECLVPVRELPSMVSGVLHHAHAHHQVSLEGHVHHNSTDESGNYDERPFAAASAGSLRVLIVRWSICLTPVSQGLPYDQDRKDTLNDEENCYSAEYARSELLERIKFVFCLSLRKLLLRLLLYLRCFFFVLFGLNAQVVLGSLRLLVFFQLARCHLYYFPWSQAPGAPCE